MHGVSEVYQDEEVGGVKIARGECELWDGGWMMEVDDVVAETAKFGRMRLKVLKGV